MSRKNKSILVFSCTHVPYNHPDSLRFLRKVFDEFDGTRVVCLGDEVDLYAMSQFTHDPDMKAPGKELRETIKVLRQLHKIFPRMDIIDSNHGSRILKRAKAACIPATVLRSRHEIYNIDQRWQWHKRGFYITLPNGQPCVFAHMVSKSTSALAKGGVCTVQGHYHTQAEVSLSKVWSDVWAMSTGCLIDDTSPAFDYNKEQKFRPIMSCGVILNSQPILVRMVLKSDGRWNGKVF
jgi:hypothetical protein